MKINVNDLKPGMVIDYKGQNLKIISTEHMKMGRQSGFLQAKMKNLSSGATISKRFNGGEKVEKCHYQEVQSNLSYKDGDMLVVLDEETWEEERVHSENAQGLDWLLEGEKVILIKLDGKIISISPPAHVVRKVIEAPPAVKGNTATGATKEIFLEGNVKVQAPLFVNAGDKIKVDTEKYSYIERA